MDYIAHIRNDDKSVQTLKEHLVGVEQLATQFGKKVGVPNLAGLAGILHDMGKFSNEFKTYIIQAVYNPENPPKKGSVDHSTAGGKYIYDLLYTQESTPSRKLIAEVLGNVIISHHMGLQDFLRPDLSSDFLYRVTEKEILNYDNVISQFEQEMLFKDGFQTMLIECEKEIKEIIKKDNITKNKHNVFLTLTFLTKYIFSCLIDADRTNTRLFEENNPLTTTSPTILNHQELFQQYYSDLIAHIQSITTHSD